MTKIKLCGLSRPCDIEAANSLRPDYIGFVFAKKSSRCVSPSRAAELKSLLDPGISAVGVFVDEDIDVTAGLLREGVIDAAQLHGNEDEAYIRVLRERAGLTADIRIIRAFRIRSGKDLSAALHCTADLVLLDAGAGDGKAFDWSLLNDFSRPYFLAGGLNPENAAEAIRLLHPFGLDVSSGIETDGRKDPEKMAAFVRAVRNFRDSSV